MNEGRQQLQQPKKEQDLYEYARLMTDYRSISLSICLPVCLSVNLSVCLSVCLSVWSGLSVCLSVCLSSLLNVLLTCLSKDMTLHRLIYGWLSINEFKQVHPISMLLHHHLVELLILKHIQNLHTINFNISVVNVERYLNPF